MGRFINYFKSWVRELILIVGGQLLVRYRYLKLIDQGLYLASNPDVRNAVACNSFVSARSHLILHGLREVAQGKRKLNAADAPFNQKEYLANHLDVADAISAGAFTSALEHFIIYGRGEIAAGERHGASIEKNSGSLELDLHALPLQDGILLAAPVFEHIKSSIVIPVYNNADLTFGCIASILRNTAGICFEIIIVDDASDEVATKELRNRILNVTWLTNETNLGYLKSCNVGAAAARGEYIFMVNNDVLVQPHWMTEMLKALEVGSGVGCVGGMAVFPDGTLQEAGGIIFSDGSGWNYGRGGDPAKHEYSYVKPVDYVSGCAFGISISLWQRIGGYSEEFAPAYYEDVDLAFKLRKVGLEVRYVPTAKIVHMEGRSYGDDTSGGLKATLLETNRRKFVKKWQAELDSQIDVGAMGVSQDTLFFARDRSSNKRRALYIDDRAPNADRDAGSGATISILRSLIREHQQIHFLPANFNLDSSGQALTAMGIEVLAGGAFDQSAFCEWLTTFGGNIDTVVLSRPHIAPEFLDLVRKHTDAKCLYVAHDLAYVRRQREAAILGDQALSRQVVRDQKSELELLARFDARIFFSESEASFIRDIIGLSDTVHVPVLSYGPSKIKRYVSSERTGVLFVGGFGHPPNLDGVLWFLKQVWPRIYEDLGAPEFFIVGSKMPDEIFQIAEELPGIILLPDADRDLLDNVYGQVRVVIAPLRFGAGVKGKVIEAMYQGVPVVTTSVGIEGICGGDGAALVADDPEGFAHAISRLYRSESFAEDVSSAGRDLIKRNFSYETIDRVISSILPPSLK